MKDIIEQIISYIFLLFQLKYSEYTTQDIHEI